MDDIEKRKADLLAECGRLYEDFEELGGRGYSDPYNFEELNRRQVEVSALSVGIDILHRKIDLLGVMQRLGAEVAAPEAAEAAQGDPEPPDDPE